MVRWTIRLRGHEWRQGPTEPPAGPQTRDHVALARAAALGVQRSGGMEKYLGGRDDGVCDRLGLGKPSTGRRPVACLPCLARPKGSVSTGSTFFVIVGDASGELFLVPRTLREKGSDFKSPGKPLFHQAGRALHPRRRSKGGGWHS